MNGASSAEEYAYDKNGNLTKDLNKGIDTICYNCLSLPDSIRFTGGDYIVYEYDAEGTKLCVTHKTGDTVTKTDYCGNAIYENDVPKTLLTKTGYVSLGDSKYHYYIQDHQGNNRVVVNSEGSVEEVNHYYPFGGLFATSSSIQPYKYNGKELDSKGGLNWYDYGARHYDATLGRWHVVDPMAEKYYATSLYGYCVNNPMNTVDHEGKIIVFVNGYNLMENLYFELKQAILASEGYTPQQYNPSRSFQNNDFYGWKDIDKLYMQTYNDRKVLYVNGSFVYSSSAQERYEAGIQSGQELIRQIQSGTYVLDDSETIKLVGYSMGGAYAAGMAYAIMQDENLSQRLQFVDYLAPYQPKDFTHPNGVLGRQFASTKDYFNTAELIQNMNLIKTEEWEDVLNMGGHLLNDSFSSFLQKCFESGIPVYIKK